MEALPGYINGFLALLLVTAFVKISTALSIMRVGIGLQSANFGLVIFLLSFALSLLVVSPQLEGAGLQSFIASTKTDAQLERRFRPFLEKHAEGEVLSSIAKLSKKFPGGEGSKNSNGSVETPFPVLLVAFLLSELKNAFLVGLIILIPFVVIDVIIVNLLMSLDVKQMSYQVVSFPLKLLLFFVMDGWLLVSEKLIRVYAS